MATLPLAIRENPIPVVLSLATLVAVLLTAGVAVTGGSTRTLIRLTALSVVLAVFAGGFWLGVVGERMG